MEEGGWGGNGIITYARSVERFLISVSHSVQGDNYLIKSVCGVNWYFEGVGVVGILSVPVVTMRDFRLSATVTQRLAVVCVLSGRFDGPKWELAPLYSICGTFFHDVESYEAQQWIFTIARRVAN